MLRSVEVAQDDSDPEADDVGPRPRGLNLSGDFDELLSTRPVFRTRVHGYDKLQVDNYVSWAEDELAAALHQGRHHSVHARSTYNPPDFSVEASRVNPWNDPRVSDEDGVRHALAQSSLYGTAARVAEQVAELRDAGVHHVLCQMTSGEMPHATSLASMRAFGEQVIPKFR